MPSEEVRLIRGEHLQNLIDYINGIRLKWSESRGYSSGFAIKHDDIIKDIVENPQRRVKVVSGLDDICNCGLCPKIRENCVSKKLKREDESVAAKYNIILTKEYRSKELIKTLVREARKQKILGMIKKLKRLPKKIGFGKF